MVEKFGTKFQACSKLFDHAAHNGSNYLNGHCFVGITLHVPFWSGNGILYFSIPPGLPAVDKRAFQAGACCHITAGNFRITRDRVRRRSVTGWGKIRMNIIIRSLGQTIETIKKDLALKKAFQEFMIIFTRRTAGYSLNL